MSDLVELDRYADATLAHIVRGRLEAEGIAAFCFDSGMNLAEGAPIMFTVRVMVLAEDLDAARQVIARDAAPFEGDDDVAFDTPAEAEGYTSGKRRRRMVQMVLAVFILPPLLLDLARCTGALN